MMSTVHPQRPANTRNRPRFSHPSQCCWFDSNAVHTYEKSGSVGQSVGIEFLFPLVITRKGGAI
jgi:hypothetical protein